jgi:alpha-amylase
MRKNLNKFLALLLALVLCFGGFGNAGNANAATLTDNTQTVVTASGQQSNIQDGVTLHCWNWSYKNIEANMALIASLGYTAIQTSPIQQSKEGTSTYSMDSWWLLYQPMGFHIDDTGRSGLGTKAEFKSMCNTAHQYGVKVIVDIVANHTGNQTNLNISSAVPADLRNDNSCWHYQDGKFVNTTNYNSRYEVTQFCMNGIPDLNTGNPKVQNYVIGLLKQCIDAGADGFRFDAAKHIELPSSIDTDYCGSDFWPNVINSATTYAQGKGKKLYCYGELLDSPGGGIPSSAYTTYMSITDNSWGNTLRGNINSGHTSAYNYAYHKGNDVLADKLVLWAESHDTFAGGESKEVSQQNINKTWALVAARDDAMGLYFARPISSNLNETPMGTASVTGWAASEVAAVNKFHNAFVGQSEYVSNEGSISYCERGTSGVVLVNCSGTNTSVSVTAHTMAAGTYKDQITGNIFKVANGKITGDIGGTGIAVVYNASSTATPSTKNVAYIELPSKWGNTVYCYAYNESNSNNGKWPGVAMTKVSGRLYKYEVPSNITNPKVIFYSSDANRYPADLEPGLALYGSMIYKNGQWTLYDDGSTTPTNPNPTPTTSASQEDTPTPTTSSGGNQKPDPTTSSSGNQKPDPTTSSSGNQKPNPTTSSGGNQKPDPTTSSGDNQKPDPTTSSSTQKPDPTTSDKNNEQPDSTVKDDEENPTTKEDSSELLPEETHPVETNEQDFTTDDEEESSPSNEESSSTPSTDNNTPSGKKFPWAAVVIPIVLLGSGIGIYVFIKKRK